MIRLFFVICLSVLVQGCATATMGTTATDNIGNFLKLKPGVSSKYDVFELFGQPHDVVNAEGGSKSTWIYYQASMKSNPLTFVPFVGVVAGGMDKENTVVEIVFDQTETFQDVTVAKSKDYVNQWEMMASGVTTMAKGFEDPAVKAEMDNLTLPYDPKIEDTSQAAKIGGTAKH